MPLLGTGLALQESCLPTLLPACSPSLAHPASSPFNPNRSWVRSVTFDPSNEWFATGSADRTIKIWDTASGQLRLTLTGHIEQVRRQLLSWRGLLGGVGGGVAARGGWRGELISDAFHTAITTPLPPLTH